VDFSSVAIEKAKKRTAKNKRQPAYLVGDVTNLPLEDNQYDIIFDIGCFHCLNEENERKYVAEAYRLLKPNGTLLIWTLYKSPMGLPMDSELIATVFAEKFTLEKTEFSRRRIIASNWFWLKN
jgi:ubiquinone/menaquinone biosynthesis C-methylase UbiE